MADTDTYYVVDAPRPHGGGMFRVEPYAASPALGAEEVLPWMRENGRWAGSPSLEDNLAPETLRTRCESNGGSDPLLYPTADPYWSARVVATAAWDAR